MIDYCWFTAQQCDEFHGDKKNHELARLLARARRASINCNLDDFVCLLAIDKSNVAGRILFTYGHITHNQKLIRVAAAQDLFTNPQYRGQGIGASLITKSLEIGMPCIYSGISAAAMPLYKKLGFSFIDRSPIYQFPIGFSAILKEWRGKIYSQEKPNKLHALRTTLQSRSSTLAKGIEWLPLDSETAKEEVNSLLQCNIRPFQIPWNPELLLAGFKGENTKLHPMVLEHTSVHGGKKRHMISIYRKTAHVRLPFTSRNIAFSDGHLTEIYPPPSDTNTALDLIGAAINEAKKASFRNLSIYAMTDSLQAACESLALSSYHRKSVAIQPTGMSTVVAEEMLNPENWWCRVRNEDQIEEAV